MKNTKDFVAYDYLTIRVPSNKEALYIDCYENFGWQMINSHHGLVDVDDYYLNNSNVQEKRYTNLKFKRDRILTKKEKLINLQKKMEKCLKEVERLEKEPSSKGAFYAVTISVIGVIFLATAGVFITSIHLTNIVGIITGLIGFICWFISYPIYKKVKTNQEDLNESIIEEQYNLLYDACEQANKIINSMDKR